MKRKAGKAVSKGVAKDGYTPVRLVDGMVTSVDRINWTCKVKTDFQSNPVDAEIMPVYLGGAGNGLFYLPEVGSQVYVAWPSHKSMPVIIGGAVLSDENKDGEEALDEDGNVIEGGESNDPSFAGNRPTLNEGDIMMSSEGGNFLIMREGGVIEIGSSQVARRYYIPISNFIRDFCSTYEMNAAGGQMAWSRRRGADTWGTTTKTDEEGVETEVLKTPVEFSLDVKEFAEEPPIISLKMGRIEEEDEERLIGNSSDGEIVVSLNVNDHFKAWIDKKGNLSLHQAGTISRSYEKAIVEHYQASQLVEVKGLLRWAAGQRHAEITKDSSDIVHGDRMYATDGDHVDVCKGGRYVETQGPYQEKHLSVESDVSGSVNEAVVGQYTASYGSRETSVAGNDMEMVSGQKSISCANAMQDGTAFKVTSTTGEIQLNAALGVIRLASGGLATGGLVSFVPTTVAACELVLAPSGTAIMETRMLTPTAPGTPTPFGRVETSALGASMQTPAGSVKLDMAGNVALGAPGGHGAVVTTLSHPVCYVTGAPILGVTTVGAAGVPGPAYVPNTNVPDLSAGTPII